MRIRIIACLAAAALQTAAPAFAGNKGFQVFGAIDDGSAPTWAVSRHSEVPADLRSKTIVFQSQLPPGSVIVRTGERKLYYVLPEGKAIAYHVGVGKEGFTWSGTNVVSRKAEWPDWRPPAEMIAREARRGRYLPDYMPGGPNNPLGARAIYIGDTMFRIHGTSQPWSIGQAVSSGCIRMMNEEVIDLYNRVQIGALVVVED
ncbi:MAG: L,D-transpeptidase [Aestuariivirga sp.]